MKNYDEIDRFKYSVMVITALSTFSYLLYNYFQNNAVGNNLYILGLVIISSAIIYIAILILYVFFKGFANEIQNFYVKNIIDKCVPSIYKNSFLITIILFFYSSIFWYIYINQEINDNIIHLLLWSVIITGYLLHVILMSNVDNRELFFIKEIIKTPISTIELKDNEYFENKIRQFRNVLIKVANEILKKSKSLNQTHPKTFNLLVKMINIESLFFLIFCTLYLLIIYLFTLVIIMGFMPGDVQIDMSNTYYKSNAPIPVSIEVTGPDNGLFIELLKENLNHNLTLNDSLDLESIHNPKNTVLGNNSIMMGNALENGKYNIFINTTNLTGGYYELVCFRNYYKYIRGFYLLNQ